MLPDVQAIHNRPPEWRTAGVLDRTAFESTTDNEVIETALAPGGQFNLQWRPIVSVGQVDQTLTANSAAVLDIQEDSVRLVWRAHFALRQSERESFTLMLPEQFLVEQVMGDNVRGWRSTLENERQRIDITLLQPATKSESVTTMPARPRTLSAP